MTNEGWYAIKQIEKLEVIIYEVSLKEPVPTWSPELSNDEPVEYLDRWSHWQH